MEIFRVAKEILDYVRQFRGKIIVVKVSKDVLVSKKKLSNVIRDMILLKSVGIEIVVTHSDTQFVRDPWFSLDPVVFLDISTISGITGQMDMGITPVVFFGETSSLSSEKAIASLAIKLGAVKIVYVTNYDGIFQAGKFLIHEIDVEQAGKMLNTPGAITQETRSRVEVALMACMQGIPRIHVIGSREGSLLRELLTCDGSGTMIYESMYQEIRKAKKSDVVEIFEIIGESIRRTSVTLELIEKKVGNFWVFAVDRQVHGCIVIEEDDVTQVVEIAYLGVSAAYEDPVIFERLIRHALEVISPEIKCIFLDPEKNTNLLGMYPWFKKIGFSKHSLHECGVSSKNTNKVWVMSPK
ncbi:MAG: hypothetical protein WC238_03740 [Parcubacteria group bacterium]|jgi:N-acetylglutamate synthase-like GNAT family acetyltransferase